MLGIYNTMFESFAYSQRNEYTKSDFYKQLCPRVLGLFEEEQGRIKRGPWIKLEYAKTVLIYAENFY